MTPKEIISAHMKLIGSKGGLASHGRALTRAEAQEMVRKRELKRKQKKGENESV